MLLLKSSFRIEEIFQRLANKIDLIVSAGDAENFVDIISRNPNHLGLEGRLTF